MPFIITLLLLVCCAAPSFGNLAVYHSCKMPEICVGVWKCPYYSDLLHRSMSARSKAALTTIRRNLCGVRGSSPEVCCMMPMPHLSPQVVQSTRIDRDVIEHHANFHLLHSTNDGCGFIGDDFRITSGANAAPGEFPWMALIAYKVESDEEEFRCGGSLINGNYILTAAHCIDNATMLGVRLGEHNILTDEDCDKITHQCQPPIQDLLIDRTIVHPQYNPASFINDIALIRLATPANMTQGNVKPICLPVGDLLVKDLSGKLATVTGWGVTENGNKSPTLRKITIPIVPNKDCRRLYRNIKLITRSQLCAGGFKGRDSCAGDSGGPLQHVSAINNTARFVQYGVVSYGPKHCGVDGRPGIYTNVVPYMPWILDNIEP